MTILHIDSSISGESSVSRTISQSVVDQFKAVMPGARVIRRDTEPSAVFRSDAGGDGWVDLAGLRALPSTDTVSFPPLKTGAGSGPGVFAGIILWGHFEVVKPWLAKRIRCHV